MAAKNEDRTRRLRAVDGDLGVAISRLGCGGDGNVCLHELETDGDKEKVAVKSVTKQDPDWKQKKLSLRNEAIVLQNLQHKNIVKYFGSFEDAQSFRNVLEYHRHRSLEDFLNDILPPSTVETSEIPPWGSSLKQQFAYEISEGMFHLHQNQILHLDLKPLNILISNDLIAKIGDFGCAWDQKQRKAPGKFIGITNSYAAPEWIFSSKEFVPTTKCDIYSFGMLCWSISTQKIPFSDAPKVDTLAYFYHCLIRTKQRPSLEEISDKKWRNLVKRCWNHYPEKRPSAAEINRMLKHKMSDSDYQIVMRCCSRSTQRQTNRNPNAFLSVAPSEMSIVDNHSLRSESSVISIQSQQINEEEAASSERVVTPEHFDVEAVIVKGDLERSCNNLTEEDKEKQTSEKYYFDEVSFSNDTEPFVSTTRKRQTDPKMIKHQKSFWKKKFALKAMAVLIFIAAAAIAIAVILNEFSSIPSSNLSKTPAYFSNATQYAAGRCQPLVLPESSTQNCTNSNNVGSVCHYSCEEGFQSQETKNVTCLPSLQWSSAVSECACRKCFVGAQCQYSTSWNVLRNHIVDRPWSTFVANYAGRSIKCEGDTYGKWYDKFNPRWDCECTDVRSGVKKKCFKYVSSFGSCENALAGLLRMMIARNEYPKTCEDARLENFCLG